MSYTHRLKIAIPASLYEIGREVARAMDPDTGGAESWGPKFRMSEPAVDFMQVAAKYRNKIQREDDNLLLLSMVI